MSDKKVVIELQNVKRDFIVGSETVHALKGVSFKIYEGEFVTIMGTSGSGKSTLLNQLGCLDTPTSGEYILDGTPVRKMKRSERAILRNRKIGFIFQNYNLLARTTAVENVELPLMYNNSYTAKMRREAAVKALQAVGLGNRLEHKSNQMSGGQMQRVAIARALINDPEILLADEPTGALDSETSIQVMELLKEIAKDKLVIMVTHNPELAEQYATRIVRIKDGELTADSDPFDLSKAESKDKKKKSKKSKSDKAEKTEKSTDGKKKKVSMSFGTAVSLSLNNLMTKKGRTLLTAFAGLSVSSVLLLSSHLQRVSMSISIIFRKRHFRPTLWRS